MEDEVAPREEMHGECVGLTGFEMKRYMQAESESELVVLECIECSCSNSFLRGDPLNSRT